MILEVLLTLAIPLGLDLYLPVPEDNPLTVEKIELGRRLFFDPRLSRDGSLSCATCHNPARGFADAKPVAVGIGGRPGRRNAPALINRGYGRAFFWDARIATLEEQVVKPIEDPNELGSSLEEAAARVGVPATDISRAISAFVRSILSANSPFDRFVAGDRDALSADEQAGLRVFRGKGNCVSCHVGPTFTDERTHNTGVAWRDGALTDRGAGRGDFKTPTLREAAATAPYMHDGSLATLEAVIEFYDGGGRSNPSLDVEIRPLNLTAEEKRQLAVFLRTLSGTVTFGMGSLASTTAPRAGRGVSGYPPGPSQKPHDSRTRAARGADRLSPFTQHERAPNPLAAPAAGVDRRRDRGAARGFPVAGLEARRTGTGHRGAAAPRARRARRRARRGRRRASGVELGTGACRRPATVG